MNENHEVVRKDQFFQQVDVLKLENYTFQEIDDEIKEKKIEFLGECVKIIKRIFLRILWKIHLKSNMTMSL